MPAPATYVPLLDEIHANGIFSNFGPLARRLEAELERAFGAPQDCCVTSCNATAGLTAALLASGRSGDVLVPAFTFPATMSAVRAAGMRPIVVDVDPHTWAVGAETLDRALAATRAGAVILVCPFGIAGDREAELDVCRRRDVAVVIDNAAGLGGARPPAGYGEAVYEVFSMHATKPFAVGEGGAILAHRRHEAALRSASNFGLAGPAAGPSWGVNAKMSEFHAAIGLAQLRRYGEAVRRRQDSARLYRAVLADFPEVSCPSDPTAAPWQFFPLVMPDAAQAEAFVAAAAALGLEIRRYYRPSLSRWPGIETFEACPVAEDLADRMCVLPLRGLTAHADNDEIAELASAALARTSSRRGATVVPSGG